MVAIPCVWQKLYLLIYFIIQFIYVTIHGSHYTFSYYSRITFRDGHGYGMGKGMGRVYPYPTQLIYLWIPNYLIQLVSIPNCYPACLPMDIHTLPKPKFYKITKYAQKLLKRPKYPQNLSNGQNAHETSKMTKILLISLKSPIMNH